MMQRIPEPELMDEPAQAKAYAEADFEQPHGRFIELLKQRFPGREITGPVLDLGCGPADITVRFARAYPGARLVGVDGAAAMLEHGDRAVEAAGLSQRVVLHRVCLPADTVPGGPFEAVISNSLLHHLHDAAVLWNAVRRYSRPGALIFILDLMRPASPERAAELVEQYSGAEPPVLKRDFYHSLLAAFTPDEVEAQLAEAGLGGLGVEAVSDRHLLISGYLASD